MIPAESNIKTESYDYFRFTATKAYYNEVVSTEPTCTSLAAKISLLAFPVIGALIALETAYELFLAPFTFIVNCLNGQSEEKPKINDFEIAKRTPLPIDDFIDEFNEQNPPYSSESEDESVKAQRIAADRFVAVKPTRRRSFDDIVGQREVDAVEEKKLKKTNSFSEFSKILPPQPEAAPVKSEKPSDLFIDPIDDSSTPAPANLEKTEEQASQNLFEAIDSMKGSDDKQKDLEAKAEQELHAILDAALAELGSIPNQDGIVEDADPK